MNTQLIRFFSTLSIIATVAAGMTEDGKPGTFETATRVAYAKPKTSTVRGTLHSPAFSILR